MKKFASAHIDRKAFHSFFLVSLMTFLAKIAIVSKEIVMASRYGRQDELDAFLIAFLLPAFVGSLLGSAMNSAMIPAYVQVEKKEGKEAAQELFAGISFLNLWAVAVIALLTLLSASLFLPRIASGFSGPKMALTLRLLVLLLPYILLSGVSALWSAVLNARERFAAVLLAPMISPLLIVVLLLLFPGGGIRVLAYGVLAGITIETAVLGAVLRARGFSIMPRWKGFSGPVREVVRQFMPAAAGSFLMGSVLIVDQSMAAMLPPGSVAALSYGNKAIGFLMALLTTALMTFLTPYFSKKLNDGGDGRLPGGDEGSGDAGGRELRGLLRRWLGIAFPLGLLISVGIVVFSGPLVRLIFYRGAFTLADARLVAGVQSRLAWQIPFYVCAVILARYIAAMRWNRIIFVVAACNLVANIFLNYFLMKRMGVNGIALSTSLVHALSLLLLLMAVGRGRKFGGGRIFGGGGFFGGGGISGRDRISGAERVFGGDRILSGGRIFLLRRITRRLYRYRGLSRVADLVRKAYIHSPRIYRIGDFDGDLLFDCALNEHISSQVFWRGDYSTGQLALLRKLLKPGMVFLDAGANKGEFSILAAKYVPGGKVLAFEPMAETAEALEANIAANGFTHVQVIRKALGNMSRERVVYHAESRRNEELNLGTFSLYPRAGLERPSGMIGVVPLDEWMRGEAGRIAGSVDRIDVMKIDVEGGELELLEGATETIRRWKPVIFIEVNAVTSKAAGYEPGDMLRLLEDWGYRCYRIGRKGQTTPVTVAGLKRFQNLVCFPEGKMAGATGEWNRRDGARSPVEAETGPGERIAFFIPDMRGGGAERAVCNLLKEMVKRRPAPELDLVLVSASGVYLAEVPPQVRIVDLRCKRTLLALPGLVRYLRRRRPSVLIAHLSHANMVALLANKIAGLRTPVVVVEHNTLHGRRSLAGKQWFLEWGMKRMYPGAAARVTVSEDTARALECRLDLSEGDIKSIYNPVVNEELYEKARLPAPHPWLVKKEIPVFLGVGRLEPQKDFATLLEAFARVRKELPARLIILGEGTLRKELEEHIHRLGIGQDTDMPGFGGNPFAYMARCDAFVLSSRWEGLSNVLIEAMACGCPVISTDCPAGPREVLRDGTFGILVPVGDAEALGEAMLRSLASGSGAERGDRPVDEGKARSEGGPEIGSKIARSGREARMRRAAYFSAERAVGEYMSLLDEIKRVARSGTGRRQGVDSRQPDSVIGRQPDKAVGKRNGSEAGRRVVLHVITGLRTGGAERMLCQLLSALDRQRWDPFVISLTDGSGPEAWLREQGIPVYCLGMRAGRLPAFSVAIQLIRQLRRIRPDLIQGWMYHGNLAAQFANCFLAHCAPVVWSIHHSIGSLEAEKKMTIAMIRLGARLSRLPARIVYASQVSAGQHQALGYRAERAIVIPYGIDAALYIPSPEARAAVREELGLLSTDLVIGSLARYHPMKDHENFLRAAALLSRRYDEGRSGGLPGGMPPGLSVGPLPGLHFVLAGTNVDDRNPALQQLIQEPGIAERVHLLGERGDAWRLLAALDVFTVSSSRGEALPMVLLEAMSCGLPCVTTDVGDAGPLIGDTGRVVATRDPAALAGAWEELIEAGGEKRRALGQAARARILAQYTLSACASNYAALYGELMR